MYIVYGVHSWSLIDQTSNAQTLTPRAAVISEYGRRVLPCLDTTTHG